MSALYCPTQLHYFHCHSMTHPLRCAHTYTQTNMNVGQDSIVSLVTFCGLGNEYQWGEISFAIWTCPEAEPASCAMGTEPFLGVKQLEHGVDHPPPSSARLQMGWRYTSASPLPTHCACIGTQWANLFFKFDLLRIVIVTR
jgi:hypothetical protein